MWWWPSDEAAPKWERQNRGLCESSVQGSDNLPVHLFLLPSVEGQPAHLPPLYGRRRWDPLIGGTHERTQCHLFSVFSYVSVESALYHALPGGCVPATAFTRVY